MSKLINILIHILKILNPKKATIDYITQIIYMTDWVMALNKDTLISDLHWELGENGPQVEELDIIIGHRPDIFKVTPVIDGGTKSIFLSLINTNISYSLDSTEAAYLDKVIMLFDPLFKDDFVDIVFHTYPILSTNKKEPIDILRLAREYNRKREIFENAKNK